jgi:NDP-sugar pyrophosphorylase family protein
MHALILAGGKGTRLRPLTVYTPKPIVPVMNRPFLLYQIDVLKRSGIEDIILSLSYQPDKIEHLLGSGSELGVNLRFLTEPHPLGTAGAYRFASEQLNDTTVVLNGDILTSADISKIVAFHKKNSSEATITLTPVEDPWNFGLVETLNDRVKRFIEKPRPEEAAELQLNNINAGVYVLEPSVRELIPKNENRSFEYHVFPDLLENEHAFFAYQLEGEYWRDLGTPENYRGAHMDFLAGKITGFDLPPLDRSDIATHSTVEHSLIGEGCVIKPNAEIVNSVLGPGVHVEEKARIENSVIWSHTRIASSASVSGSVIARSCHVGRNTLVREGSVLGDKASIPDYSRV